MLTNDGGFVYSAQSSRNGAKVCAKCRRWGELADFPADGRMGSGRSSWCRECHREAVRDWRRRNRERENADRRAATAERRTNHERKKTPMSDPAVQAVELVRPCSKCGEPYTSHITAAMLGTLERAGVRPEEIVEAVERGTLRRSLSSPLRQFGREFSEQPP